MSSNMTSRRQIAESLISDKEYRDLFVEEGISTGLAFQLREMRRAVPWTQKELAERSGQNQSTISDFENPNYGSYTLQTLLRLASVFDVGLAVRFVPLSTLVEWDTGDAPSGFVVPDCARDTKLHEQAAGQSAAASDPATTVIAKPSGTWNAFANPNGNVTAIRDSRHPQVRNVFSKNSQQAQGVSA